jgi:hypothetical protein
MLPRRREMRRLGELRTEIGGMGSRPGPSPPAWMPGGLVDAATAALGILASQRGRVGRSGVTGA